MKPQEEEVIDITLDEIFIRNRTIIISSSRSIDAELFNEIATKIIILTAFDHKEPITIVLNSTGGDMYSTLAIYDLLRECPVPIYIKCYGACMSGASIILQAADKRVFSPNCTMMIHYGFNGFSGNSNDFGSWAKENKKKSEIMLDIYAKRMKLKNKKKLLKDFLVTDTVLDAKECLKLGLIDIIE